MPKDITKSGEEGVCKTSSLELPLPSINGGNNIMIIGTVTSQGHYRADNKEICELNICRESSGELPHEHGQKHPITLNIGEIIYVAGVHEKQNGEVWISSVLYTKGNRKEKARLVDALAGVGLKKGDKITLTKKTEAESFLLSKKK